MSQKVLLISEDWDSIFLIKALLASKKISNFLLRSPHNILEHLKGKQYALTILTASLNDIDEIDLIKTIDSIRLFENKNVSVIFQTVPGENLLNKLNSLNVPFFTKPLWPENFLAKVEILIDT